MQQNPGRQSIDDIKWVTLERGQHWIELQFVIKWNFFTFMQ